MDVMQKALFPDTLVLPPSIHPELAAICLRATSRHASNRYPSAKGMADAISEYLNFHDALGTLKSGERLLEKLLLNSAGKPSDRSMHRLAFQCQFAFEETLRKIPGMREAEQGILRVLEIMFEHELSKGETHNARRYFLELQDKGAPPELLIAVQAALDDSASHRARSDELNTQIQYKLMEKLFSSTHDSVETEGCTEDQED